MKCRVFHPSELPATSHRCGEEGEVFRSVISDPSPTALHRSSHVLAAAPWTDHVLAVLLRIIDDLAAIETLAFRWHICSSTLFFLRVFCIHNIVSLWYSFSIFFCLHAFLTPDRSPTGSINRERLLWCGNPPHYSHLVGIYPGFIHWYIPTYGSTHRDSHSESCLSYWIPVGLLTVWYSRHEVSTCVMALSHAPQRIGFSGFTSSPMGSDFPVATAVTHPLWVVINIHCELFTHRGSELPANKPARPRAGGWHSVLCGFLRRTERIM